MKRRGFVELKNPQFIEIVAKLLSSEFHVPENYACNVVTNALRPFCDQLRDDIVAYFETEYVDKVYRDSYYRYYSSKASKYPRDCIRLSFFDNSSDAFSHGIIAEHPDDKVRDAYRGFLVIRPTIPKIVGRSAISPKALKNSDFVSCLVDITTTVDGLKVKVSAFPSSSQDTESITCAETSLWALMEYYGNKYPEYTPIKPSYVIEALRNTVVGRQLPSSGLSAECLTYAIKSFGFGPRLYHRDAFSELHNILGCYIESGIPMVTALSNRRSVVPDVEDIGHAVLCVGHEVVTDGMIDAAVASKKKHVYSPSDLIDILDFDDIEKKFVFIDDNFPPYQRDYLATPTDRYNDTSWKACQVESIIAPLYEKIYMEPYLAKSYIRTLVKTPYFVHLCGRQITMRTYLCSTRSYRDYVWHSNMSADMKKIISDIFMPKFVWVIELSDIDGLKRGQVEDLILLDATAMQTTYYEPLLVAFASQKCYFRNRNTNALVQRAVTCGRFASYSNLRKA